MNCVIKGQFYKGLINWSFSYNSFVKFHGIKTFGSMLYPNSCYKKCNKGTTVCVVLNEVLHEQ